MHEYNTSHSSHLPLTYFFPHLFDPPFSTPARGALRGAVSPVSMPALSKELGIAGLASLSALVPSLVDELAAEGAPPCCPPASRLARHVKRGTVLYCTALHLGCKGGRWCH